jgi:hypothetical protein
VEKQKILLNVSSLGGHTDFSALYERYGLTVINARTLRNALALIKQHAPGIIVAEFVYAPTYGSQLSNFESLFAAAQTFAPTARFIALTHPNDLANLEKVKARIPQCAVLLFPVSRSAMENCLKTVIEPDSTLRPGQ